jgi:CheY-like chemotaxis protein
MKTEEIITGVIVADDDNMIRSVLRSKLEAINQTVFLASNGLEAVELASQLLAYAILLDLDMPHLNGLLTCQRIRRLPGNARTPIVILTCHHEKDAADAAARVGATAFFTKPFRPAELLLLLSRFLPMDEVTRQAIQRGAISAATIARSAPGLIGEKSTATVTPNLQLDRGKSILTILRG